MIALWLPIRTVSEANRREHWASRARRVKAQRAAVILGLRTIHPGGKALWLDTDPCAPIVVTMIRCGRRLDDDNLRGAFKAVRDAIAEWGGLDDGSELWRWEYGQEPAGKLGERIGIFIKPDV